MSLTPQELAEIVAAVRSELDIPTPDPQAIDYTHFQVVTGQVIQADHVNSLANQSVPKYPNQAALTTDWPAPAVGALAYLQDINALVVFDSPITGGSNVWHVLGGLRMGYGSGSVQSVPNNAETMIKIVNFGGAANKPGRGTWAATGEVTLPVSGTYLVTGSVAWSQHATGERRLYIRKWTTATNWTPAGVAGGMMEHNVAGGTALRMSVTAMIIAVAGNKVAMFGSQTSGTTLPLYMGPTNSEDVPRLGVHLLGAE